MTVTAPAASKRRWASSDAALGDERERQRRGRSPPTGTLTKKIHSQPRYFDENAAEEHAGRGARPAERAPDAERLVALCAFLEGRR